MEKTIKNCNKCSNIYECGAVKEARFSTKKQRKDFIESSSDDCKNFTQKEKDNG